MVERISAIVRLSPVPFRRYLEEYAIIAYPFMVGLSIIGVGVFFQLLGHLEAAGVAGAMGIIICALTIVIYTIYWALGEYGN